jgi:SpoVK/Ycf46/Vps4 family AAA+-type ATPase
VVKPGEWEDPFVGVTQQKIRNCFDALRRASEMGMVLLFLDEIETIGRIRGGLAAHHADKFLGALLAEIDGFADRSNVAIITATNRKDLVDPALLERLSDVEISVRRPDMAGAREIFGIHLPKTIPYSSNGTTSGEARQQIIDAAVARFYSPNADNGLCQLRLRDGKTRTIVARELASGRCIEQVCRAARVQAYNRDASGGEAGLRLTDMESALSDAMEKLASTLTRANVHAYISDLPQDVDVVSVEPIIRKVQRSYRYLNLNIA